MQYLKNDNNWLYKIKLANGKIEKTLLGIKCPHCGYLSKEIKDNEDWAVDAFEHITYCSPAHKRAMVGESK